MGGISLSTPHWTIWCGRWWVAKANHRWPRVEATANTRIIKKLTEISMSMLKSVLREGISVRVKVDQPMGTLKDKLKQPMGRVWGTASGKGERLSIVVEELRRKGGSLTNWLCPPNRAYLIKRSLWKLIVKWWNTITMRVDKVGKEEVQLTHGYINVVRVDAQVGMQTIRRLLQPFTIRRFKWYCFEQDYLDQVESPNLMKQNEKCSFETFIRKKK